ncbi:S8 family serine peptidase [Streptomyces sp. NPDC058989]|uniref:S8 family serine peptidase n=1 Tax=Streptomyces sp. NPDC058989 TaxID=3346686 RepID=UPI00369F004F
MVTAQLSQAADAPSTGRIGTAHAIPGQYIVVLKDRTQAAASVEQQAARIVREHSGRIGHAYGSALSGFAAKMTSAQARLTAADPRVAYVEQDAEQTMSATQPNPPSWGLDRIDQRNLPLDKTYRYAGTERAT